MVFYDLSQWVLARYRGQQRRLSFHTRIVVRATLILIALGTVLFFITEFSNTLRGRSLPDRLIISLFQAITPRTAGFSTVDFAVLSPVTLCIMLLLMFVGGSPGSTAGGIKTSTAAVIAALFWSRLKNETHVNLRNRRVDEAILSKAVSILLFSSVVIAVATLGLLASEVGGLSHAETRGYFLDLLFEAVSAFCTVGLSTGVTPQLTATGQVLIILLMFLGRLGPLTVALAVARGRPKHYQLARERFLVG